MFCCVLKYKTLTFRTGLGHNSSIHYYAARARTPKKSHEWLNGVLNQQDRLNLKILLSVKIIKIPVQKRTSITHSPVICLISFTIRPEHPIIFQKFSWKKKKIIHSSSSFGKFIQFWRICVFFQFIFMGYEYCKGKQSLANISIQINKHVVLSFSLLDSIFIVHCIAQSKL